MKKGAEPLRDLSWGQASDDNRDGGRVAVDVRRCVP